MNPLQGLINLVRNAAEASLPTGGGACLGWSRHGDWLRVRVIDDGMGRPSSENLFVPFFMTQPGSSGIGLVLARQIVEGHGGTLTLGDRDDSTGCIAEVCLPL